MTEHWKYTTGLFHAVDVDRHYWWRYPTTSRTTWYQSYSTTKQKEPYT